MIDAIERRMAREDLRNVRTVLGRDDDQAAERPPPTPC